MQLFAYNPYMALKYALLASLSQQPQTGYDLAHAMDSTLSLFWHATHQQIYKELAQLFSDELVKEEYVKQTDKPDKKIYSVTKKGLSALKEWTKTETKMYPTKDELLIKVFVGHLVDKEVIERELERKKKIYQERLNTYLKIEKVHFGTPEKLPIKLKYQYMTLRRGIRFTRAWIAWIDEVREFF